MQPVDATQRKIEGGVGALREPDDTNFLKPNGQSRNLHIYAADVSGHYVHLPVYNCFWSCIAWIDSFNSCPVQVDFYKDSGMIQ